MPNVVAAKMLFSTGFWNGLRRSIGHLEAYDDDQLHLFEIIDALGALPREVGNKACC